MKEEKLGNNANSFKTYNTTYTNWVTPQQLISTMWSNSEKHKYLFESSKIDLNLSRFGDLMLVTITTQCNYW